MQHLGQLEKRPRLRGKTHHQRVCLATSRWWSAQGSRTRNTPADPGAPPAHLSVSPRFMRSRMRLLYRLARSVYAGKFIPKGAMLFAVWMESGHRPARDLDLLGFGEASNEGLPETFQRLCDRTIEPDGLTFDSGSIRVAEIRESQNDPGQWVNLCGLLGIPSGPRSGTLGMRSSRMRDFYDQWVIARQFSFWKDGQSSFHGLLSSHLHRSEPSHVQSRAHHASRSPGSILHEQYA